MSTRFVGRKRELALLQKRLDLVVRTSQGVAVALRGRRQVGKSRLVQEFCDQSGLPYLFWSATKGAAPAAAVHDLMAEARRSSLGEHASDIPAVREGSWLDALRAVAAALPDTPSIVVLDEIPWLSEQDPSFEGSLQTAWDRVLRRKPVLLLLLGSDLHMMEVFAGYDRPFYGRATSFRLDPLNPAEVGDALELSAADALDACLVSGGLPGILRAWPRGLAALDFVRQECEDAGSVLVTVPRDVLESEFPSPDHTRRVLEAIGHGERTQANIAAASGGAAGPLPSGNLAPVLRRLADEKRVVAIDAPLATRPGKPVLYRIADSNLRFYLALMRRAFQLTERGRAAQAFKIVQSGWTTWRGKAIEPVVCEALTLAALDDALPWGDVGAVGGWWNRQFNPELDLVGADRAPIAQRVAFAGSIKWLGTAFDAHDLSDLINGAAQVPGFDETSGLMVVSLSGVDRRADMSRVALIWGPDDVLAAWSDGRGS